jgi:phospholipase C
MPPTIEHVIVLMLENRSFDCMLGRLRDRGPDFEGVPKGASNPYLNVRVAAWSSSVMDEHAATLPKPGPREKFVDVSRQLFGEVGRTDTQPPMTGFVENYMRHWAGDDDRSSRAVMHCYDPKHVPVLATLANSFGVCDQWHASAPCQTWSNRFFAHTGTCQGFANDSEFPVPFEAPSIFARLSEKDRSWRVYFHDVPQSIMLRDVWLRAPMHYRFFGQFVADAYAGRLPNYSFIEPRYFANPTEGMANDQHAPHDVRAGERLIAQVYNAVRSSPCWKKSLLIITYDEHGGCYDHMPPPRAVPPDGSRHAESGFAFDAYGVRVPAVIVSPWIKPGSVIRSAGAGMAYETPPYPFDHTSILSTLRALFDLGDPLTRRDAVAPTLLGALDLPDPGNDGPRAIELPPAIPLDVVALAAKAVPQQYLTLLSLVARLLPAAPLAAGAAPPVRQRLVETVPDNVLTTGLQAVARVKSFLGL